MLLWLIGRMWMEPGLLGLQPFHRPGVSPSMSITNASAIQSALQQIQALAGQAAGKSSPVVDNGTAGSFAGALQDSIRRINQLQTTSDTRRDAFLAGDPGLALNDVMVDMQKASVAFQMGVQVRNRLVSAYKDVMNMQV